MSKTKQFLILFAISMGFMLIPLLFLAGELVTMGGRFYHNPYDWFTVFAYLGLLACFFLNYYVLIPRFYLARRYVVYIGILLLFLISLVVMHYELKVNHHHSFPFPHHHHHHHDHVGPEMEQHQGEEGIHHDEPGGNHLNWPIRFSHHKSPPPVFQLSQLIFLYLIGLLIGLYLRTRRHLEMILAEKNKAEVTYLKSQINPHFLFNTFNSIYSLAIREGADQTANGMLKLSGMMRYVVSETSNEFVPLQKELDYILNFIELQKLRLDPGVHFQFELTGDAEEKKIAPLILIPFIENAFKHGVNPDEKSSIEIRIRIDANTLTLFVRNNKVTTEHYAGDSLGFGIENTRNRLDLLYQGHYSLEIEENAEHYTTRLKLNQL